MFHDFQYFCIFVAFAIPPIAAVFDSVFCADCQKGVAKTIDMMMMMMMMIVMMTNLHGLMTAEWFCFSFSYPFISLRGVD